MPWLDGCNSFRAYMDLGVRYLLRKDLLFELGFRMDPAIERLVRSILDTD